MSFWRGRKVLITGGSGFLGSFVVERLEKQECKDIFIPRSRDYNLVNMEAVERLYKDFRPDIVFHLAARVGGIGANRANPGGFFYDNLMMGVQMMEVGRRVGIDKFVTIGTACSYPKFAPVPFSEKHFWNGYPEETNAPYGLAKKMLLVQGQAYREQYGFNSIYLIPVNLYGPRDKYDLETSHVIPGVIRKCLEAKERGEHRIVAWGTGNATREFLYVEDAAEGILLAAEKYNGDEPVNLGSGKEICIKDLVVLLARLTDFRGEVVWDIAQPDGQPRRCLDTSSAERLFGYKARTELTEGLTKTVEWYRLTRRSSLKARDYC